MKDCLCLGCKAHKLMVWRAFKALPNEPLPTGHVKMPDGGYWAIRCTYLSQWVQWPSYLEKCDAFASPEETKKQ